MSKKIAETPLMKQYIEMKRKHPDAVLLFRVGDFYETFSDDAITASEILGITLTRRANGAASSVELAGFPHHALDTYLPKLVRAGKRVAICEQLEDPKLAKGLVKRDITELVTPGVSMGDNLLNNKENNFVAALHADGREVGVAFLDISTGEFLAAQGTPPQVEKLLSSFQPKELLAERGKRSRIEELFAPRVLITELDDWIFTPGTARERLLRQFGTNSLKGFGITGIPLGEVAAGAILQYLDITRHNLTRHITRLQRVEEQEYVRLDRFTVRNLELVTPLGEDGKSLLQVIDRTVSPMGGRMLRRWVLFPLKDPKQINGRLDIVEAFIRDGDGRDGLRSHLETIGDLERLVSKVAVRRILPRELLQLRNALASVAPIRGYAMQSGVDSLAAMGKKLNPCDAALQRISKWMRQDPAVSLGRGPVIAQGVDKELDELRAIAYSGKDYLIKLQQREIQATGIPSLKIGFNNVFGYYIEVTNTHRDKVPGEWIRKQTLVNAERYITQELKEYEEKILGAQEKIDIIESRLYNELIDFLLRHIDAMQQDAAVLARLDCLSSLALVAIENRYNRPVVDDSLELHIAEARHPVIEKQLPPGECYVTNSITLDNASTQVMMITGPNMSGKSALLRSTALSVLMAQMGSYVPAESAHIGVIDKIFTRVGASDNISQGESTFMVEMNEAAAILNNLSERSLILFDELGRGTSTYDGISIAWAIVEYIHRCRFKPKTLFATHYHELNEMERSYKRVVNYNVSVKEIDGKVVFLRKLSRGGSEHSFGIHVAKLAGMPASIVARAGEILVQLEKAQRSAQDPGSTSPQAAATAHGATSLQADTSSITSVGDTNGGTQLSFFQLDDPVLGQVRDEILGLDINNLTPMAALNKLHDIRRILTGRD